jgi:hypothetical protein
LAKNIIILEKDEGWRETWQLRMEEWGIRCGLSCLEKYKKDCYIFIMKKDHYERRRKMACVISFYTTLVFDVFFGKIFCVDLFFRNDFWWILEMN